MEVKATVKNSLTTARKACQVIDLVRGKPVNTALAILNQTPRRAAGIVEKLIKSAVANAVHNYGLSKDNLFIKSITAEGGMVLKRWMPRAHGHATSIHKKRSHITVWLDEIEASAVAKETRKSKMKTYSYEEVKKIMSEAEKAAKVVKKKGEGKGKIKEKFTLKKEAPQGEQTPQKEIESRPHFTRLGDTFKRLFHRTTKKG